MYNPYNRTYQQYYPQYPTQNYNYMQQPVVQTPEPQLQGIKFLNAEQIKAYIVMPGTKELLVDNDNGLAYLVSADAMGVSTTKRFSFKSLDEPKTEQKESQIDLKDYITHTDLDKFAQKYGLDTILRAESITTLENKIKALESRINEEKDNQEVVVETQ